MPEQKTKLAFEFEELESRMAPSLMPACSHPGCGTPGCGQCNIVDLPSVTP